MSILMWIIVGVMIGLPLINLVLSVLLVSMIRSIYCWVKELNNNSWKWV